MRFTTLILRNLLRRRTRTLLTATGLAVAIAAVLDLMGIALNFERSFLAIFEAKGIDLVIVRAGISNQLSSNLDIHMLDEIQSIDGVAEVAPTLMDTVSFEDAGIVSTLINGWQPDSMLFRGVRIINGRPFRADEPNGALLGRVLALNLGKQVGDPIDIVGEPFQVVGIFESDSLFENGSLIIPTKRLQQMMGREDQVTGFVVRATTPDRSTVLALQNRIESRIEGVAATPARDQVQNDIQIRLARAMAWATTAIALLLGSVGMLNTMMMAVFDRTQEIGILRALGWKRSRILKLILGEAMLLGILGTFLGMSLAIFGLWSIVQAPTARGFIEPNLPPSVFLIGLVLGLLLSLLGGLYPALRASALDPSEALRHD